MRNITIGVIQSASEGVLGGDASIGTVSAFAFYEPADSGVSTSSVVVTYEPTEIAVSYVSAMAFVAASVPSATGQCDVGSISPVIWHRKPRAAVVGSISPVIWHRRNRTAVVGSISPVIWYRSS